MQKPKRIISLGFIKPDHLKGDIIYAIFEPLNEITSFIALYSNNSFKYEFWDHMFNQKTKQHKSYYNKEDKFSQTDPDEFLQRLAKLNNAEIDDSRLLSDGLKLKLKNKLIKNKLINFLNSDF